jgi:pyruvate/2-oxoglutarate dehydrogenase complex dihydrolipoamide acyltransferase (E2) component
MSTPNKEYYESPYPSSRRLTFDLGRTGLAKHHVKALLEVDVTEARTRIRQSRRNGARVSFFAWLVKTTADSVASHLEVNGFNDQRHNKVVLFRDVDISIAVEKQVGGMSVPLPYVVRKAQQKTIGQIQQEIEAAKSETVENEGHYVLGTQTSTRAMKSFVTLPQWLRLALMRAFFFNNPRRMKSAMGTVMITTVGMAGHARGWIVPFSMHPVCLAFGSVTQQPAIHEGAIQKREILHLTVLIDHDVVDGVPAARFADDLVRRLESGSGIGS